MKRILSIIMITFILVMGFSSDAMAKEDKGNSEDTSDYGVTEKKFGPYKDEKRYYEDIDTISHQQTREIETDDDDEDGGFSLNPINWAAGYVTDAAEGASDSIQDAILSMMMAYLQLAFGFHVMFSEWMLTILSFSNDASIINWTIDGITDTVKDISGVSHNKVKEGSGIFGKLLGIFVLITACYVAYQALVKRAPIQSLKTIVQTVIAIALSLLILSNFNTYVKGVNEVGNEFSSYIVNLTVNSEKEEYAGMEDRIWKIFVHRPYLYLQFGTDNEDKIGDERIEDILLKSQESSTKQKAIVKEVTEYDNEMMQPSAMIKRLVYQMLFAISNTILSIPIWLLSAMLIGLQIWFLIIACMAPFVLVWSALPGQFGILKGYAEALLYPFIFKLIVSFIAMILFTISDIVYSMPSTDGLAGYMVATFLQFMIFIVAFIFRNRFKKIFERGASSEASQQVGESWDLGKNQVTKPVQSTIQGGATTVGVAAGAYLGGTQGAMIGADLGKTIGGTATGKQNASDLVNLPSKYLRYDLNDQGQSAESNIPDTSSTDLSDDGLQHHEDASQDDLDNNKYDINKDGEINNASDEQNLANLKDYEENENIKSDDLDNRTPGVQRHDPEDVKLADLDDYKADALEQQQSNQSESNDVLYFDSYQKGEQSIGREIDPKDINNDLDLSDIPPPPIDDLDLVDDKLQLNDDLEIEEMKLPKDEVELLDVENPKDE